MNVAGACYRVERDRDKPMHATVDLRLPFAVRPLTPNLGAEISGVNLAQGVSDDVFRALYRAWLRYQLLLFPPQDLSPERHVEFARRFGEVFRSGNDDSSPNMWKIILRRASPWQSSQHLPG